MLIVDDEKNSRYGLSVLLSDSGYSVMTASNGFQAMELVAESQPDVVLADLKMPGMSGIELLKKIKEYSPEIPVILITAYATVPSAVEALKLGAEDYLIKPVNVDELEILISRVMEKVRLANEVRELRRKIRERYKFANIVGNSPQMQAVMKTVIDVADSKATVLIQGESGTGKEVIANAIHYYSSRRDKPFIKVSCAALAETVLESELFGHERGAFTGAITTRKGRFELAHQGTLFLDDIAEISPSIQVKLLRFLQEHEFERVGSSHSIPVDVRLVAATNKVLRDLVEKGTFREDLYYRLNVITINLPPLRERVGDIPLLVDHFIKKYARENNKGVDGITPEALRILKKYPWPGNIRELENVIERAVVLTHNSKITPEDLPELDAPGTDRVEKPYIPPGMTLKELEREAILKAMELSGGSTTKAARMLGISVRKIQYKLKEYAK